MPVTCKVINEILKFGSSSRQRERGGGLHYISAALAPTQSNVASESKLPDEMDSFLYKTVPILHKSSTNLKQIHNDDFELNFNANMIKNLIFSLILPEMCSNLFLPLQ